MCLHYIVSHFTDCYDHYRHGNLRDGLYKVKPTASKCFIKVFCDMQQGGWTIIQKRQDGTTDFFQDWKRYKEGFGGDRFHYNYLIIQTLNFGRKQKQS